MCVCVWGRGRGENGTFTVACVAECVLGYSRGPSGLIKEQ